MELQEEGEVRPIARVSVALMVVAAVATVVPAAIGLMSGPLVRAGSGDVTLFYAKPFMTCTGADGHTYRQVLNWKGHGTVHSTYPLLDGKRMTDNVDFFQNADSGKGIVRGTVNLYNGSNRIATGTFAGSWRGNVGGGQIILNPNGGGFYVLNTEMRLQTVSNGINVHIVFGKNAPFNVPANTTASFNGQKCP